MQNDQPKFFFIIKFSYQLNGRKCMLKSVIQPRHRMPCFMLAENNNGDICVSDLNAELVVVVDRNGGVRFRYDGAQAKRRKSFDPRCIVTDSCSQIIVTDMYNVA